MLPLDTFHTLAEVGIAITGFAGIVAAIRGRADSAVPASIADPLRALLLTSLGTVFFCFVPEWLNSAIADIDTVWRVSLGANGAYRLVYMALFISAQRSEATPVPWRMFSIAALLAALQLVGAAGFLTDFHYFLYLSGLLWGLLAALSNFYLLLRSQPAE